MKRLLFIAFAVVLTGTVAKAQFEVAILAGPSFTKFAGGDATNWGSVDEKPKFALRLHGGVLVAYPINEKLSGISGLQYSTKGAKYSGTEETGEGTITAEYNKVLSYIDIPLSVQYALSDKIGVQAGTQVSILVAAKTKNGEEVQEVWQLPASQDSKDSYNTLDMCFNLGLVYKLAEKISAQLLFQQGLLRCGKSSYDGRTYDITNQGLKLSVIYTVKQP
jgi:hypothetical protein